MPRPGGVTAIAVLFFSAAAYLCALAAIMLLRPGALSMTLGAPLLHGFEIAGPYAFLLAAGVGTLTGVGLMLMKNWGRRLAIVIAIAGIVMLLPAVSAAVGEPRIAPLAVSGGGVMVRAAMVWYLWQTPVAEQFGKSRS